MSEQLKTLKARVQHKHKTEENWLKDIYSDVENQVFQTKVFRPLPGELIIYDRDENYNYERYKIGRQDPDEAEGVGLQLHLLEFVDENINTLTTTNKNFVGAINELEAKSLNKISYIDTWATGQKELEITSGDGISWSDTVTFMDVDDNLRLEAEICHRVPIEAGDNVTFTIDENNQVVKINAGDYSRGLAYILNDDGNSYSVSGIGTCTDTNIIIPRVYKVKPVTSIGDHAFFECESLKSIIIPSSVTGIDHYAFYKCSLLTDITIPNSVRKIGESAFMECTALQSIDIPSSVTRIQPGTFYRCSSLKSITIPNSVTNLGWRTFQQCTSLTSIIIPDSITSIDSSTFRECTSLKSVIIPDSITDIYDYAFGDCEALSDVYFKGTQIKWTAIPIGENNDELNNATIHYNYADSFPEVHVKFEVTQNKFDEINTVFDEIDTTFGKVSGAISRLNSKTPQTSITYAELKSLRDNSQLIPGQFYRITNYQCTTTQENTRAMDNKFDIIVQALSANTLSENASADHHTSGNISSSAIESDGVLVDGAVTWYYDICEDCDTLGNGTTDYTVGTFGGYGNLQNNEGVIVPVLYKYENDEIDYGDVFYYVGTHEFNGTTYDKWRKIEEGESNYGWDSTGKIYALTNVIVEGGGANNYFANSNLATWELKYCLDNDTERFGWAMEGQMITNLESPYSNGQPLVRQPDYDGEEDQEYYYAWGTQADVEDGDSTNFYYSKNETLVNGETVYFDGEFKNVEVVSGKGVIYWMKDEYGNECPYDFKNIQFKRYKFEYNSGRPMLINLADFFGSEEYGDDKLAQKAQKSYDFWYDIITSRDKASISHLLYSTGFEAYTKVEELQGGTLYDFLIGEAEFPIFDEDVIVPIGYDDESGEYTCYALVADEEYWFYTFTDGTVDENDGEIYDVVDASAARDYVRRNRIKEHQFSPLSLGNNIFLASCFDNIVESECYNNTFAYCNGNHIGYMSVGNCVCGEANILEYAEHNILISTVSNNIHKGGYFNVIIEGNHNTLKSGSLGNILKNSSSNCFGEAAFGNSFYSSSNNNVFGSNFSYNTINANMYNNTFGDFCAFNDFDGGSFAYNTVGDGCYGNSFEHKIMYSIFEDGVSCIHMYNRLSEDAYINYVRVCSGVHGEDEENLLTITPPVDSTTQTIYRASGSQEIILDI